MSGKLSELLAVVATIDPDVYTAAAYSTDVIDMHEFEQVMFIVLAGTLGTSATLDFKVQGCATSGGTYADFTTAVEITQLTQAGTDSDKQVVVVVTQDMCLADGYNFIKGVMTIGTADSDAGVVAIGGKARFEPASDYDLASVDEIV